MCFIKRLSSVRSVSALDKTLQRRQIKRPSARRLAQLYCALLYNAHIKGFIAGEIYTGNIKALCTPGLNCYSCPGAVAACPLGAMQNALAASGTRAGTYVLGILLLFGLILGRTMCGWLCPFGMVQELLHKIPTFKIKKSRFTRGLSYLKYLILLLFAIALPLWYGLSSGLSVPAFCKYICPAGTSEGALGLLASPANDGLFPILGRLFTQKYVVMAVIGLACVFCYRSFCRFLCPLGAIYGLFSRAALIGFRVDAQKCTRCGACVRACPMDVKYVGDHECIHCGQCKAACGADAISMECGTRRLDNIVGNRLKRVLQAAALAILLFALLWFNIISSGAKEQPTLEKGHEIGQQLMDFSIETIDGSIFTLSEAQGDPIFINLWATYCAPCVQELSYFSQLHDEHPEVNMLAVHSSLVTEDIGAFLAKHDWNLTFAVDSDDDRVFSVVGGSSVLPQTIVLNARGEVVYNQIGSVTYEKLSELLSAAW